MQIVFVLVEPAVPGNVGASARALKTMGFNELRLVNPCDYLSTEANMFAHGSNEILSEAKVYEKLTLALKDCDFSIGTSAKRRRVRQDYYSFELLPGILKSKGNSIKKVAVVFGREESGLNNEELRNCNIISYIPMKTSYPSLNLAQAVMLYAFELSAMQTDEKYNENKTDENSFVNMRKKAEKYLHAIELHKNQVLYNRIMERLNILAEDDIHLLHSVFKYLKI